MYTKNIMHKKHVFAVKAVVVLLVLASFAVLLAGCPAGFIQTGKGGTSGVSGSTARPFGAEWISEQH